MPKLFVYRLNEIGIKCAYRYVDKAKSIPGGIWRPEIKAWSYPATYLHFNAIVKVFKNEGLHGTDNARLLYKQARDEWRQEQKALKYSARLRLEGLSALHTEDKEADNFIRKYTTPYKHQAVSFHILRLLGKGGLLLEAGTGKTKIAIDLVRWWRHTDAKFVSNFPEQTRCKTLVICPNSIKFNWGKEIEKHSFLNYTILDGSNKNKIELLDMTDTLFYILNYEVVHTLLPVLQDKDFSILILDESSKIKNKHAMRTEACVKLGENIKHKIIMSGTPMVKAPEDIFSQFFFLDPNILGRKWSDFAKEYIIYDEGYGGIIGYKNLDKLHKRISRKSIRYLKSECLDLPPKVYQTLSIKMSNVQQKLYDDMAAQFLAEWEGKIIAAPIILTQLLRLTQITSGHLTNEEGIKRLPTKMDSKFKELKNLLMDEFAGEKVVIWCRFIDDVKKIAEWAREKGVAIWGEVKPEQRQESIELFNNDPNILYFIGQTGTGGMGINLPVAHISIYFSLSYSLEEYLQSQDRTHRIGQEHKCTYVHLCCRNSIDFAILDAVQNKKKLADIITGDNLKNIVKGK